MSTSRPGAPLDHPTGTPTPMVLIVEDEEPIAAAIAMVVEDAGYEPVLATNGHEALAILGDRQPALVLTDLMMPRMDGFEFIAALRMHFAAGDHDMPPVVLMTAGGPRRAQEAGADAILWKPFEIEQLEKLLDRFLDTSSPAH